MRRISLRWSNERQRLKIPQWLKIDENVKCYGLDNILIRSCYTHYREKGKIGTLILHGRLFGIWNWKFERNIFAEFLFICCKTIISGKRKKKKGKDKEMEKTILSSTNGYNKFSNSWILYSTSSQLVILLVQMFCFAIKSMSRP